MGHGQASGANQLLTELDTDEILISDYEVDAIVERMVKQVKREIRSAAILIITYIAVATAIILKVLLG